MRPGPPLAFTDISACTFSCFRSLSTLYTFVCTVCPSASRMRRIFVSTGELGGFGIIEILLTSYIVVFVLFRTLCMSVCVVDASMTFTEPSFSSLHHDSAPIDDSEDFWGHANDLCYFCSCYHVNSSITHLHVSDQCIRIFPDLSAFSGLNLVLLPGEFTFIQPFRGILMHSGLSLGFLKSISALCACAHTHV